ncbi:hypothetical protein EOM81_10230 [bacterium]|nr:hypothetical protein [bacterium]
MNSNEFQHWGILDMKWGRRRYQNEDGSLTKAGQVRYAREKMRAEKDGDNKKKKKIKGPDPDRWVTEDITRTKKVIDASSDVARIGQEMARDATRAKKVKMDLSQMSEKDMRDKIQRTLLERQYNDMFAPTEKISKGKEYLKGALEVGGGLLAVTSSALSLALAIRELKGL